MAKREEYYRLQELSQGIFLFSGQDDPHNGANAGFIVTDEGVVVIDGQFFLADRILSHIRNLTGKRLLFAINTHMHRDHTTANFTWQQEGATIIASRQTRELMKAIGQPYFNNLLPERGMEHKIKLVLPQLIFDRELTLNLGNTEIQLRHFGPAHTAGDIAVYLPQKKIVFTGDLLFAKNHCVIRAYSRPDPHHWMDKSLPSVMELPIDICVPGHGAVSRGTEDLKEFQIYLKTFRTQVQKLMSAGKSLEEIKQQLDLIKYKNWGHQSFLPESIEGMVRAVTGV